MIREVRDLLPVIADKHFDPLFDGFGWLGSEHATANRIRPMRKSHAKPKWQRQLSRQKVSPSRLSHVRDTDARKLDGRHRNNGLCGSHGDRHVGKGNRSASPQGRTGRGNATPADLTEKVSAGASEAPAIPDLAA
jgi:hypothetical protein